MAASFLKGSFYLVTFYNEFQDVINFKLELLLKKIYKHTYWIKVITITFILLNG